MVSVGNPEMQVFVDLPEIQENFHPVTLSKITPVLRDRWDHQDSRELLVQQVKF